MAVLSGLNETSHHFSTGFIQLKSLWRF